MAVVSLLLICHGNVGAALVETAQSVLGCSPLPVQVLCAAYSSDPDDLFASGLNAVNALDQGGGVLVLTDLYGSTPSNIAVRLMNRQGVKVIAGVNLPMMIRIFNYCQLSLDELVEKALDGGRDGVFLVGPQS